MAVHRLANGAFSLDDLKQLTARELAEVRDAAVQSHAFISEWLGLDGDG